MPSAMWASIPDRGCPVKKPRFIPAERAFSGLACLQAKRLGAWRHPRSHNEPRRRSVAIVTGEYRVCEPLFRLDPPG